MKPKGRRARVANSKRKCGNCKNYFKPEREFPGTTAWCSDECGAQLALKRLPAQRKKIEKQENAKHRAQKRKFRESDLGHQKELTRKVCNKMIRLLDRGKNCPTCNEPLVDGRYDAGHVRTVSAFPELRFDPRNIFGQCRSCNGSGTHRKRAQKTQESVSVIYQEWVLRTKGQAYYDWLFGPHESKHYTCKDLIKLRAIFAAEVLRLEKGLPPSRDWRALEQAELLRAS